METLRLKNYRKFEDTGDISLKPLTLLIGANSSGKSSFLKFFPLIKQTVRRRPNGVFLWYSDDVDFKDFNNTVRKGAEQIEIDFSIKESWGYHQGNVKVGITVAKRDDKKDYLKQFDLEVNNISIQIKFPIDKSEQLYIIVNGKEYKFDRTKIVYIHPIIPNIFFDNGEDRPVIETSQKVVDYLDSVLKTNSIEGLWTIRNAFFSREEIIDVLRREGLLNKKRNVNENFQKILDYIILFNINRYLESIAIYLESSASNITYIQPLRAMAERYYRIQNIAVDEIDSHGDNLAMYLYSLGSTEQESFSNWLNELFKFKIDIQPNGGHVEIKIEESSDNDYKNLVDVGFGYSQLLPILASIWNALNHIGSRPRYSTRTMLRNSPDRFIVIEQPELHLHPRFIAMFAKMILQIICTNRTKRLKFIIETHSETLINYIGKYLAKNVEEAGISEEDISIVLFNARKEGFRTDIIQTGYDSEGYLKKWPYGFFSGEKAINDKDSEDDR